ncbi:hypothetical protein [Nonomuraea basaltis]|uniref:hypothetical protein n=1 Tax=Nonomuraea basaltis TaxID=2495887 RepID=UPI00110C5121|nr:hypothetical protein [Nonomuraea basaltis]TMR97081.1 hypothetical protein EJK15_19680 [Nonomuraea basaltis]
MDTIEDRHCVTPMVRSCSTGCFEQLKVSVPAGPVWVSVRAVSWTALDQLTPGVIMAGVGKAAAIRGAFDVALVQADAPGTDMAVCCRT